MIILYDFHFFGKNILASSPNHLPDNKKGRAPSLSPYFNSAFYCHYSADACPCEPNWVGLVLLAGMPNAFFASSRRSMLDAPL